MRIKILASCLAFGCSGFSLATAFSLPFGGMTSSLFALELDSSGPPSQEKPASQEVPKSASDSSKQSNPAPQAERVLDDKAQSTADKSVGPKLSDREASPTRGKAEDRTSRATARAKGDLTFDDIKFDIEKDGAFKRSMLTEEIEKLNKQNIRIRGFILPASVFKLTGITEFVLVRDNMECCFGPGAALYDCIIVHMAKGTSADFSTRPVMVRGKFEIREFKYPESDQHYAIYFMTATEVK